ALFEPTAAAAQVKSCASADSMADSPGPGLGESSSPPGRVRPAKPRRAGPTAAIAPLCGVAAVATEYTAGAAKHTATASAAAARATGLVSRPATSSSAAAPTPPTATVARSHGIHSLGRD